MRVEALRPGLLGVLVEALGVALTYLEHQRAWIGDDQQWRDLGYPVGSGLVERAVALIINQQMKRQGMRWRRANATAVVALRVRTRLGGGLRSTPPGGLAHSFWWNL
jgi:hypothetical protein